MYRISEFLTPTERLDAMRIGGLKALVANGITPSGMSKVAADVPRPDPNLLRSVFITSIVLGIPIGVAWHALEGGVRNSESKTRRLREELDQYNDVVDSYRSKLGRTSYA